MTVSGANSALVVQDRSVDTLLLTSCPHKRSALALASKRLERVPAPTPARIALIFWLSERLRGLGRPERRVQEPTAAFHVAHVLKLDPRSCRNTCTHAPIVLRSKRPAAHSEAYGPGFDLGPRLLLCADLFICDLHHAVLVRKHAKCAPGRMAAIFASDASRIKSVV